jgi:recombination protein RecA
MRLDVRRVETIKSGDQAIGNKVKVKVVKNKTAQPFREGFVDIIFGEGISKEGSLIDVGVEMGIVDKSGTWLSFGETKIGQGRDAGKAFLKEHTDVAAQIEKKIKEKVGLIPVPAEASSKAPADAAKSADKPKAEVPVPLRPEVKKDAGLVLTEKAKVALRK